MQQQAVEVAQLALAKFQVEKEIAQYIKKEVCRTNIPPNKNIRVETTGYVHTKKQLITIPSSTPGQELRGIVSLAGILGASSPMV